MAGMKLHGRRVAGMLALYGVLAAAQAPAGGPRFEVASIKPSEPGSQGVIFHLPGGKFRAEKITLRNLIGFAYGMPDSQILDAPRWADGERFDVNAAPDTDGGADQAKLEHDLKGMVQTMLAERFKLEVRRETRDLPVYGLIVGKGGAKFHANSGLPYAIRRGRNSLTFQKCSMAAFVGQLNEQLHQEIGRPVVDKTGMEGEYDLKVSWSALKAVGNSDLPSIFEAVQQQLGLKLEPGRGPVEMLVVDHAERPSAN